MAQDTLEVVAGKINALTDKIGKASVDVRQYRVTRNQLIIEAHGRLDAGELDVTWEEWVSTKIVGLSYNGVARILRLASPKVQEETALPVVQDETVEPEAVQAAVRAMRSGETRSVAVEVEADPVERVMMLIKQLSLENTIRLNEQFRAYKIAIGFIRVRQPKPQSRSLYPEPSEEELNAVERFFSFDISKQHWVKQRFDEVPHPLQPGPHCDWVNAFWGRPKEFQEIVKLTIKRREEATRQ